MSVSQTRDFDVLCTLDLPHEGSSTRCVSLTKNIFRQFNVIIVKKKPLFSLLKTKTFLFYISLYIAVYTCIDPELDYEYYIPVIKMPNHTANETSEQNVKRHQVGSCAVWDTHILLLPFKSLTHSRK